MAHLTETIIEQTALAWPANLGFHILFGPNIASDMPTAERDKYWQAVIADVRKKHFRKKRFMVRFKDIVTDAPKQVESSFL